MTEKSQKILVTGVFDILHQEHLLFLQKAAALGDLYIGIESDVRVRKIKGEGRPVNSQEVRKSNLDSSQLAKGVFILPESFDSPDAHRKLLQEIKPDVLAVSSHTAHLESKSRLMQEIGGRVEIVHQHNPEISTTKILESARKE